MVLRSVKTRGFCLIGQTDYNRQLLDFHLHSSAMNTRYQTFSTVSVNKRYTRKKASLPKHRRTDTITNVFIAENSFKASSLWYFCKRSTTQLKDKWGVLLYNPGTFWHWTRINPLMTAICLKGNLRQSRSDDRIFSIFVKCTDSPGGYP